MSIFKQKFKVGDKVLARLDDQTVIEGTIEDETNDEFYVFCSDDNGCYHWSFDKAKANKYFKKIKTCGKKKVGENS